MSKLETTITTEVEIAPEVQAHLAGVLSTYTDLKMQIDALTSQLDTEKAVIKLILEDAGVDSVKAFGYSLSIVKGTTSTLDKAKLKAQGVTEAMLLAATTVKPKKPYLSVRGSDDSE
jgi:hypothetical protein